MLVNPYISFPPTSSLITGVEIVFTNSDFIYITEVALYDVSDVDVMLGLTANSTLVDDFADLADNTFGTDSTFDDNEQYLNLGWPTTNGSYSPGTGIRHRSQTDTSGLRFFMKKSASFALTKARIAIDDVATYGYPTIVFKDQTGATLSPITSPSSSTDTIWTA
jgi:hypothetical protein